MTALTPAQVEDMLHEHRCWFRSGRTRSLEFRLEQLSRLAEAIKPLRTSSQRSAVQGFA